MRIRSISGTTFRIVPTEGVRRIPGHRRARSDRDVVGGRAAAHPTWAPTRRSGSAGDGWTIRGRRLRPQPGWAHRASAGDHGAPVQGAGPAEDGPDPPVRRVRRRGPGTGRLPEGVDEPGGLCPIPGRHAGQGGNIDLAFYIDDFRRAERGLGVTLRPALVLNAGESVQDGLGLAEGLLLGIGLYPADS